MAVTFLTNEDKNIIDGQIGKLSEEIVKRFATVAAMLSDANLTAGQLVRTGGYYAEGDGGYGEYLIVNEAAENPYDTLATANGKYAILQHNGHVNAKQCGLQDNATEGGDLWIAHYNGTAKSLDINVRELRVSQTILLNKTTEIFSSIYPSVCLYWTGGSDAAVFSCFSGDGLHATAYQSTTTVKLHDISINARTARVGFCLVNIATSSIWNLMVYKGYIGFLMGNSWRNIFGRLHGSTQTYATFYQNEFINTDIFDFSAITTNGSINASVYEMMTSVFSPNGALLMGHGSDNVFHMIEASEISDGENGIGVRFGEHSGTVNTIYTENAVPSAHYDLYVDNLLSTAEGYDYNKGLMINQVRGRRFYLNNNVTIGTLFVEDWVDQEHSQGVVFEGGEQASRVTILHMPAGKYNESNLTMPYGLNGTMQELQKMQPKRNYRLIETVTVETAEPLLLQTEPDGTPYNFDAVYMEFILPASTAFPGCNIKFYTTGLVAVADPYLSSVSAGEDTRYMFIEAKNENGFVRETHSKFDMGSNHQALYTTANKAAYKQPAKIVDIRSTQPLQPRTVVNIYAY
jgi:hypothetical protein